MRLFFSGFLFSALLVATPSPLGQFAKYQLDKDPKRTSSVIKSGEFFARVTQFLLELNPAAYEVTLDYTLKIMFHGTQQGKEKTPVEETYFDPKFMEDLRVSKHFEGANFKVDHLGFKDAVNLDGHKYPHCDVLKFYDIEQNHPLANLGRLLVVADAQSTIENLVIGAHYFSEIPVLGGAKIDVSGVYDGFKFKAGGDYATP